MYKTPSSLPQDLLLIQDIVSTPGPGSQRFAQKIDNARTSSASDSDSEASSSAASEHDTETEEVDVVEKLLEAPKIKECEKELRCEVRQMHRDKTLIFP